MERIKELCGWGDLTREAYQTEREPLQAELATLRGTAELASAAAYLRNVVARAWADADPAARNEIARALFARRTQRRSGCRCRAATRTRAVLRCGLSNQ